MSRSAIGGALGALVVAGLLAAGAWWLRSETQTVHDEVQPDSALVVELTADRSSEAEAPLPVMVEGLVRYCQLEIGGRIGDESLRQVDDDRFRFVVRPGLDAADQDQLAGCLQDWTVDHLLADVDGMACVPEGSCGA